MTWVLTASSTSTQVGASELRGFEEPQPLWSFLRSGSAIPLPAPRQVGKGGAAPQRPGGLSLGDQPGSGRSPPSTPCLHLPQASCWFWGWAPAPVDVGFAVPSGEVSGFGSRQPLSAGASGRRGPGREWSAFQTHTGLLKRASLFTGSRPWGYISLSFVTCLLRLLDFCRNKIWASRSPLPSGGPAGVLDGQSEEPVSRRSCILSR